jgi:NADH-quinone oxidoreductase subunit J
MITLLTAVSTGQAITFWICAVLAIVGAIGVVASARPVYSALFLALVMMALAALYASLEAEFLFVVQIIVYTGAVLMLFLFVIMLLGVTSRDSLVETLKFHRVPSLIAAFGLVLLLTLATGQAITSDPVGLTEATADGYMQSLAQVIFQRYVIAFEATAGLLITAALAAMVLAHPRRLTPKPDQETRMKNRLRAFRERGLTPASLPATGVMARHNSMAVPALLPEGSPAPDSVSATVADRVVLPTTQELTGPMVETLTELGQDVPPVLAQTASSVPELESGTDGANAAPTAGTESAPVEATAADAGPAEPDTTPEDKAATK